MDSQEEAASILSRSGNHQSGGNRSGDLSNHDFDPEPNGQTVRCETPQGPFEPNLQPRTTINNKPVGNCSAAASDTSFSMVQKIFWHHNKIAQRMLYANDDTILSWYSQLRYFFSGEGNAVVNSPEREFLKYYLKANTPFCLRFLFVNILLLLVAIYVIAQERFGQLHVDIDPTFDAFQVAIVELLIWICFSLLCFGYFVVAYLHPRVFETLRLGDPCDIWYEIGAAILASRMLIFLVQIFNSAENGSICLDSPDLLGTEDSTFGYVFIKMSIDAFQTYTFVLMPFPQPWAICFTLLELCKQEYRLFSCSHRITTNPLQMWIIQLIAFLLVVVYITLLLIPSLFLEKSVRNRYKSTILQSKDEKSKQDLVEFLSSDVRAPLQYMLHAVTIIDFIEMSGAATQPLLADINKHARTINDIADDLLLLVRIQEKRYTSRLSHVADLRLLFEGSVQAVLQRRFAEAGNAAKSRDPANAAERIMGHHGTLVSRARDCSIYTAVPSIAINVDEKCLLAVLRHLLIFITQDSREAHEDETDRHNSVSASAQAADPDLRIDMELTARVDFVSELFSTRKPTSVDGQSAPFQVLRVTLSGDKTIPKGWSEQRKVHEATTAYICHSIAASCGGTFTATGFTYELVLPCQASFQHVTDLPNEDLSDVEEHHDQLGMGLSLRQEDFSAADSIAVSVQTNLRSIGTQHTPAYRDSEKSATSDRAALEEKVERSADMQARIKRNRVCVFVDDPVLENVIVAMLRKLHLDEDLSVLHELQKGGYVPVAKLTFVTSFELCVELRVRRRYSGLIVLIAGSVNYLDDSQMANLDFSLPLPATDLQLSAFVDWLIDIHVKEGRKVSTADIDASSVNYQGDGPLRRRPSRKSVSGKRHRGFSESSGTPLLQATKANSLYRLAVRVVTQCRAYWRSRDTWFFVTRLPPGTVESYYRWKLLNPSRSWFHHSAEMWFTCVPRVLISIFLEYLIMKASLLAVLNSLANYAIILGKSAIYKYIVVPLRGSMALYWFVSGMLGLLYFIYAIIGGIAQPAATQENLSLSEFLGTMFYGGRFGGSYLYSQIMTAAFARLYAIYMYYPLSIIDVVLVAFRSSQLVWLVIRTLCTEQMSEWIQLIYIQMVFLNIIFLTYMEDTYRREFKTAHEHILAKAFLDQCLDICQHDIRKPLEFLLQRQKDLMQVAVHAVYTRHYVVNRQLLGKLEPLLKSRAMLSETIHALYYGRNYLTDGLKTPLHSEMESMQLNRGVSTIISNFSSSAADFHVKIFSEIDNKLAVVRVDWRMLSMILTNLVSAALRNIRDFCGESPRNKDLLSFIKIKIVAIESEVKVPFVHPRLMLINVCDSSNAASKTSLAAIAAEKRRKSAPEASLSQRWDNYISFGSDFENTARNFVEHRDRPGSQYERSVCEQLVHKMSPTPVFQTIGVQATLQTVQRFTFPYHLTPQTRRAQDFIRSESVEPFQTVSMCVDKYLSDYQRVIFPVVRPCPNNKSIAYFSGVLPGQRQDTLKLIKRFDQMGWSCYVKYIVSLPSMNSVARVDCVLIDHHLEIQENVNICDTVLKLRVCGFNGVIAVVLQEGLRNCDLIRDELSKSAAAVDLIINGPIREQNIQALTVALEKKYIKTVLNMNCSQ